MKRLIALGDGADFQRLVDNRLHALIAEQWDEEPQYVPPTYPYHPHIRLRRYEAD